ncbi:BnaC04g13240D [Brassica napus]|uniref:Uncharacterized protein n=2 Tax=Brassica TaxID=3705 RepID=A0A3P6C9P8_BRAOL|nr:unnamed protein product [Brassica napus]CDY24719.1 BnaC04g13240D [Brassica napus]VDD07375.1 unnamed protein product [Brassica oleracea]
MGWQDGFSKRPRMLKAFCSNTWKQGLSGRSIGSSSFSDIKRIASCKDSAICVEEEEHGGKFRGIEKCNRGSRSAVKIRYRPLMGQNSATNLREFIVDCQSR